MRHLWKGFKRGSVAIAVFYLCCSVLFNISAWGEPLQPNDMMPDIQLPVPLNDQHKNYLGLRHRGKFFLDEINTRFLLIQIYSMY